MKKNSAQNYIVCYQSTSLLKNVMIIDMTQKYWEKHNTSSEYFGIFLKTPYLHIKTTIMYLHTVKIDKSFFNI